MADLRQRQDRGVAALPGQPVLAADHQHMLDHAGLDQMMRQHGHGEPGGAADLHGVGVGRANAEMLGEHGGQHDVRRDRGIAAEDAVDLARASGRHRQSQARAALLMRSSEDEPSCLPNAVSPTPVMKLMAVRLVLKHSRHASSFRDAPGEARIHDPAVGSGSRLLHPAIAPRNDGVKVPSCSRSPSQYDFGKPSTFSAMKLRMSCGLIGAMRGIRISRK